MRRTKMLPCVTSKKKQPGMIGMHGPAVTTVPTVPLSPGAERNTFLPTGTIV